MKITLSLSGCLLMMLPSFAVAQVWHKKSLNFTTASIFAEEPTTFRDYRLDVVFIHSASGTTFVVPGFFAADGDAANTGAKSGNIWRVNFTPDRSGTWNYSATLRVGANVAAETSLDAGLVVETFSGSFTAAPTDKTGEDFRAKGMILQEPGTHYLRHQGDGDYFVRGGPGIPENFLANPDIDGTTFGRHDYSTHSTSYQSGDPTWGGGKGKNIIGAINYLAGLKQNTIYILTLTAGGDGRDVWPWANPNFDKVDQNKISITDAVADHPEITRNDFSVFDVSKLAQWEIIFDHLDNKGLYKNILLQETENNHLLDDDSGDMSVERRIYIREMIARFGHANGLQWNVGEENTNTTEQRKAIANFIKDIDPYDHVVVIHTYPSQIEEVYDQLLGDRNYDGSSFQTDGNNIRNLTIKYRQDSAAAGDPWVMGWDEDSGSRAIIDLYSNNPDQTNERLQRQAMWGFFTAGGSGVNWYIKNSGGHSLDQNFDAFEAYYSVWTWTAAATQFYNTQIPFWGMRENDALTSNPGDYVSSLDGLYYLIYLPYGEAANAVIDLTSESTESFEYFWYNPRTGGQLLKAGQFSGGTLISLGTPPEESTKDWVILIRNISLPPIESIPVPQPPPSPAPENANISLHLVNANTDEVIQPVFEGSVLSLEELGFTSFSIAATTDATSVLRVDFTWEGSTRSESVAPYSLFGDTSGDYIGRELTAGPKRLTVEVYAGSGALAGSLTVNFEVTEETTPVPQTPPLPVPENADIRLHLVNAITDEVIQPVFEGSILSLEDLGFTGFSIAATTDATSVLRVDFTWEGSTRSERVAPYSLFGDTSGDYIDRELTAGQKRLTVEVYSGSGALAGSLTVNFEVTEETMAPPSPPSAPQKLRVIR